MSASPINSYHSASVLASCATILITVDVMTAGLFALSNAYQIQLLDICRFGGTIPSAIARAQDSRQFVLAAFGIGVGLAAVACSMLWVYRTSQNAHALGTEGMTYSPGSSVWWFFIPVAGLFVPYFIVKELWQASCPSLVRDWRRRTTSPVLGVWWAVMVANAMVQYSSLPILLGQRNLESLTSRQFGNDLWTASIQEFFWGRLVCNVLEIAAGVLTVAVIVSITHMQQRRHDLAVGNEPESNCTADS